ncbi:tyrosine-type recombinase/integrase [Tissierella praeacuta]|uniref:tyrosine-type recombinase/integrase n=1 Tax=Tissierella praeacuta TaxID=43131 RepID=UPI003DA2995A
MSYTKVDKNKYRIFISDGFNLDSSRRRFSKTITTDLKGRDLERFLMLAEFDFEDEVKKKDPKFQELAKGSFEEYSAWWLEYKKLAPKTKQEYQKFLNTRILKYISNKILEKLTAGDMLELMKSIEDSPAKTKSGKLSSKTIKHYHTLLNTMFNDAIKLKILSENPMENVPVKAPKVQLKDNYYDLKDIKKLLDVLYDEPIKYQLATLIALSTGARIGEISALQWKHINYDKMEITIEQSNCYTKEEGSFIKDTKNEYSERTVAFPSFLIDLFKAHEENELLRKEILGNNWYYGKNSTHEEDFIFTQENGKSIFVGSIPKWFRKLIKKHNLKHITFHGLRHTNTTVLINQGINIVSISHVLGHAKTSTTTNFYAHHIQSVERTMADTFDNILKNGTKSGTDSPNLKIVK